MCRGDRTSALDFHTLLVLVCIGNDQSNISDQSFKVDFVSLPLMPECMCRLMSCDGLMNMRVLRMHYTMLRRLKDGTPAQPDIGGSRLRWYLFGLQHHSAIFGCALSSPLSSPLTSPTLLSPGPTQPLRWRNKGAGKLGHITLLKAVYFASLSLALPSFFSTLPPFHFLFPTLTPISPKSLCHFSALSVPLAILCVPWFPCGSDRERERHDLVEECPSLHAVSGYYFSLSALTLLTVH